MSTQVLTMEFSPRARMKQPRATTKMNQKRNQAHRVRSVTSASWSDSFDLIQSGFCQDFSAAAACICCKAKKSAHSLCATQVRKIRWPFQYVYQKTLVPTSNTTWYSQVKAWSTSSRRASSSIRFRHSSLTTRTAAMSCPFSFRYREEFVRQKTDNNWCHSHCSAQSFGDVQSLHPKSRRRRFTVVKLSRHLTRAASAQSNLPALWDRKTAVFSASQITRKKRVKINRW